MTDRNTNRLPYAFAVHAHRGIISSSMVQWSDCCLMLPIVKMYQIFRKLLPLRHVKNWDQ